MKLLAEIFEAILDSSLMLEDLAVRWVFVAFILLRDKNHEVKKSVFSIADRAHVSEEDAQRAIERLCAPDPRSHRKEHDGRRLLPIEDGWFVVNGEYYRKMAGIHDHREKEKIRKQRQRAKSRDSHGTGGTVTGQVGQSVTSQDPPPPSSPSPISPSSPPLTPSPSSLVSPSSPPATTASASKSEDTILVSHGGDSELTPLWLEYELSGGPDNRRLFDRHVRGALRAAKGKLSLKDVSAWMSANPGRKAWDIYDALVPKPEKATPKPEKPFKSFEQIGAEADARKAACTTCRGTGRTTQRRALEPTSPYWRAEKPYVEVVVSCPACNPVPAHS